MFDIISFGEFRMLEQALNGLAAITATGSFGEMMRVAFLVGILTFGARALMTNKWDAVPLLTGFIAYSVMFTPKVTTTVTDAYGGGTVVVANVPIGLAAPLAITSHVGRFLATTFESAFSVITPGSSYLTNGYMEPLTVLLKMRDGSFGYANSDTTNNGNFERTLSAYVVQCVYYDLELDDGSAHEVTIENIKKTGNTLDAIKTTFMNISVLTEVPGIDPPGGTIRTCADAYNTIKAGFDGTWVDLYFDNFLQSKLQVPVNPTAGTAQDRVGAALSAIQLSSADARMYMVNTLLANTIKKGEAGYAASHGDVSSAVIRTQALEQRNVEWAAEKSLFEKIARPVTAFIEVFMVCGGPIMAFAIAAFGPAGLGTLVKFLMMHVWVCLWMPTMTICNMYLYTQINRYVTTVGGSTGANLLSYGSMDDLNTQLQTWVAVGSMLAAATPTLTLMLIWGSNQVATTLASRMHSSGHIDPTMAAPPLVSSAPFVQNQSGYGGNPELSYTRTGASQNTLSTNNTLVDQQSSAAARMEQAQKTASAGLSRTLTNGVSGVDSVSVSDTGTISATGSRGKALETVFNSAFQAGRDSGMSKDESQRFAAGFAMNYDGKASVGTGGAMPGVQAGLGVGGSAKIATENGLSLGATEKAVKQMSEGVRTGQGVYAKFGEAVGQSHDSKSGWSFNHEEGDKSARDWRMQQSDAASASKSYGDLKMANAVFGNSTSWTMPQLADDMKRLQGGDGWEGKTMAAFRSGAFGGNRMAQDEALGHIINTPAFQNQTSSMTPAQKEATAATHLMLSNREANGGQIIAALSSTSGADRAKLAGGLPDAGANKGVASDVAPYGSVAFAAGVKTALSENITAPDANNATMHNYSDEQAPAARGASTNRGAAAAFATGGEGAVRQAAFLSHRDVANTASGWQEDLKGRRGTAWKSYTNRKGALIGENIRSQGGAGSTPEELAAAANRPPGEAAKAPAAAAGAAVAAPPPPPPPPADRTGTW